MANTFLHTKSSITGIIQKTCTSVRKIFDFIFLNTKVIIFKLLRAKIKYRSLNHTILQSKCAASFGLFFPSLSEVLLFIWTIGVISFYCNLVLWCE